MRYARHKQLNKPAHCDAFQESLRIGFVSPAAKKQKNGGDDALQRADENTGGKIGKGPTTGCRKR